MHVERLGQGPQVVLIHGSIRGGQATWSEQQPLAERWTLVIPDRPGFQAGPLVERVDFEVDAPLVAELLAGGVHLVGHSYGGVVSLLAAAQRPEDVRSLVVSEPPAFAIAVGDPAVDAFIERGADLWDNGPDEPAAFLAAFVELVGSNVSLPDPLTPELERGARLLMVERPAWEAEIPLDALAAAPFPTLVVSGGHHPAFDAVCDVLEQRLGAERAVIPGAGHSVPRTGAPFNERLETFLRSALQ